MSFKVHNQLVKLLSKQLAPILKDIIGTWLIAFFDPSKEVSRLANGSFQTAFPNKMSNVLQFTQIELVSFLSNNLLHQSAESMSDVRYTTPEDRMDKYTRVVSGSFDVMGLLLGTHG
jgi:E3 ubiquitin-protein ligase listerin